MSIMAKIKTLLWLLKQKNYIPVAQQMNTTNLLEGKVALITGGTGGIGFAMAENFAMNGAKVIVCGTDKSKLSSLCTVKENLKPMYLNVLDVGNLSEKIEEAVAIYPQNKIDILVNSAGVINESDFLNMTEQEYDRIMDINAKGTFFVSQAVSKYMIDNQIKGHILNVTSSSALRPAWTPYQMSKWAIKGFTLGLADTLLPYGIIVNAIAPGPVATQMLKKGTGDTIYSDTCPAGRCAMPKEIAQLAAFMVSDMGNLIVGDTFYITGGSGTISYHN